MSSRFSKLLCRCIGHRFTWESRVVRDGFYCDRCDCLVRSSTGKNAKLRRMDDDGTQEIIVAAACRAYGVIFTMPRPARHHNILHAVDVCRDGLGIDCGYNQGFITSTGRFVGRIEAKEIAIRSGQIVATKYGLKLYSEDLW